MSIDSLEEQSSRECRHCPHVVGDDRDRGIEEVGEEEVLEAHECDAMLRVGVADRVDRTDREDVLRGEKRGRGSGARQHGPHGVAGVVDGS